MQRLRKIENAARRVVENYQTGASEARTLIDIEGLVEALELGLTS